jgi:hypothetical protein
MKRPAFQFYPADWRKDIELRACSVAARGLWIEMMCIAHECEPYGHLVVNERAMTPAQIAGQACITLAQCKTLLQELIDNGVASVTETGVLFSRRMVKDEAVRNARAEGGKAGSQHGHKGAEHGLKGGRPRKDFGDEGGGEKPPFEPPSPPPKKPPPSSSSSSSEEKTTPKASAVAPVVVFENVSDSIRDEWLVLRKKHKAPVTQRVVDSIAKEAAKAGMTLEQALAKCCDRGWRGFEAKWLEEKNVIALKTQKQDDELQRLFRRGGAA